MSKMSEKNKSLLHMVKNDFCCDLHKITKENFEESFFASLQAHRYRIYDNEIIYVYFNPNHLNEIIMKGIKNQKHLICEEKLSAFCSSSTAGRAAFYEARILKKIRKIVDETEKELIGTNGS